MADQKNPNTAAPAAPATAAQGDALSKMLAARDALTAQTAKTAQAEKDLKYFEKKVKKEQDAKAARQAEFDAAEAEFRKPTAK